MSRERPRVRHERGGEREDLGPEPPRPRVVKARGQRAAPGHRAGVVGEEHQRVPGRIRPEPPARRPTRSWWRPSASHRGGRILRPGVTCYPLHPLGAPGFTSVAAFLYLERLWGDGRKMPAEWDGRGWITPPVSGGTRAHHDQDIGWSVDLLVVDGQEGRFVRRIRPMRSPWNSMGGSAAIRRMGEPCGLQSCLGFTVGAGLCLESDLKLSRRPCRSDPSAPSPRRIASPNSHNRGASP